MPRSRNIKYSFFLNDQLAEIEPIGRLFFIGLWTIADFRGGIEWRPKKIKAEILPYDECDISEIAINLDKNGFIRFYSNGEKTYLKITNFTLHQNPHKNEKLKGSDIPEYTEDMRQAIDFEGLTINRDKTGGNHDENGTAPADSCFLIPDSCSLSIGETSPNPTKKPKRGTRLPDDWKPDEDLIAWVFDKRKDLDINQINNEIEKFRDYWIAQPGQKGVKLNWSATWRNWIRNARAGNGAHQQDNRSAAKRVSDKLDEIAKRDIEQNGLPDILD